MDNRNSTAASGFSNDVVARRRANVKIVQNVLLIWLDPNFDDNSSDCRNTLIQLRRAVNTINIFTNGDECIEFLETMNNEKVCMILSGLLGQHIMPQVHSMSQVDTAFIFCGNRKRHEQWAKAWPKIKGVFTEISPICEALKQAALQCEQNSISISFVPRNGDVFNENLDQLEASFMYTQILKEILLTIKFEEKHIEELTDYCGDVFVENENELKNVDKLKRKYHDKTPIWWYTSEYFLYPMLNRALRLMDVDIIIKMGFFISDLHRHIEQLHSEQFNGHHSGETFTVYRGQGMPVIDFQQMTKTKGGLMSFNNFLSTSQNRNVSLDFARNALANPDLVGILFVMIIDPSKSTTPFASITDVSYFQAEDEVLFAMHTVFRIYDIKPVGENQQLFQVDLTLTSDNDPELTTLTNHIRKETFPDSTGWYRLGSLLLKMGQSDKADEVYQIISDQTKNESERAPIYQQLGSAKYSQGEYNEAITFYEKGLAIRQQSLPPNHPDLAMSYNNIGAVYESMDEYSKALSSFEKALAIQQQSLPPNHPELASSCNNIGAVYENMGEYSKALSNFEKALAIRQQSLPPNHPDLSTSYNNIGGIYDSMGDYKKALSYLEKALAIKEQSLPPNHPNLAASYSNIGMLYNKMGEYSKALSYHKNGLEIYQKALPPNHPNLAVLFNNIALVYDNLGEYKEALSFHEKALEIRRKTLPPNHPDIATSYNNTGLVYDKMEEWEKALSSHEKALDIYQKTLPSNHPKIATIYNNIGEVYFDKGDYSKAYSFYKRALDIQQSALPPNHPHLQTVRENIEKVKKRL